MKKYLSVYEYFRKLISEGKLKEGDRMPSIRKATALLDVSKTTVENAYFMLQADGFIISRPQSGYYVQKTPEARELKNREVRKRKSVMFDLRDDVSSTGDFDLRLWNRYMKNALRQSERFITYSSVRGEEDLRLALCEYVREKRNIITTPDRIVVGAGIYPLMIMVFSLLDKNSTFSFPDASFTQGLSLAENFGFRTRTRYRDADVIYVCPSHMSLSGDVMPVKRRLELVNYSSQRGSLVIEDDYDSDFLYGKKPAPSLFALSRSDNIIYIGSFSNLLLPGIRLSFMILNEEINSRLEENIEKYSQTASKAEQIALAGFIRDGHIYSQTRRIRREYVRKTERLGNLIKREISEVNVRTAENGLLLVLDTERKLSDRDFLDEGISLYSENADGKTRLVLSPSSLDGNDLEKLVGKMKKILG